MRVLPREQSAIDQYMLFLMDKDATINMITARLKAIKQLSKFLTDRTLSQKTFQHAVAAVTANLETAVKGEYALFSHEFYTFWMNDQVNISLFKQFFCFDIETSKSNMHLNTLNNELSNHAITHTYTNQPVYLS